MSHRDREPECLESPLRPLRDRHEALSAELDLVAGMLGKVEPLPRSNAQRQLLWRALSASEGRRTRAALRPLHLVPALLLAAAAAGAAVGGQWPGGSAAPGQAGAEKAATAPSPRLEAPPLAVTPQAADQESEPQPEPAEGVASAAAAPAAAVVDHTASNPAAVNGAASNPAAVNGAAVNPAAVNGAAVNAPVRSAAARAESSTRTTKPAAGGAVRPDAEGALLLEAMQARRDGDAEKMGKLAAKYQRQHPGGALEEEALALSVEAAAARKDPNTARLARDYLHRYPNGAYRAQATRALRDAP